MLIQVLCDPTCGCMFYNISPSLRRLYWEWPMLLHVLLFISWVATVSTVCLPSKDTAMWSSVDHLWSSCVVQGHRNVLYAWEQLATIHWLASTLPLCCVRWMFIITTPTKSHYYKSQSIFNCCDLLFVMLKAFANIKYMQNNHFKHYGIWDARSKSHLYSSHDQHYDSTFSPSALPCPHLPSLVSGCPVPAAGHFWWRYMYSLNNAVY